MTQLEFGPNDALYFEHQAPVASDASTFVFFNALTSDTSAWEAVIAPKLREAGHGTLLYNFRGQINSPFSAGTKLDAELIVEDALKLIEAVKPQKPILAGLSIGGLFAARAWLKGAQSERLVLINTLRQDGPRLKWIGDTLVRAVEVGGLDLFRDLFLPLLMNEDWLSHQRPDFIKPDAAYAPLSPDSGHYKLLAEAGREADWDLPYARLDLPTLVVTGLQDHVFLESAVVADLFAKLPRGRRVDMPEAGHLIPAEQPEALADILITFAKEV
jgi:3-oxoadipate enol-lactonase